MNRDREQGPDSDQAVDIAVVNVPKKGSLVVRFLTDIEGIWTHWRGSPEHGRSESCWGLDQCPRELHRLKTTWKGYAGVEVADGNAWRPAVLEVTEALSECFAGDNPRGEVWTLSRHAVNSRRSECRGFLVRNDDPRILRSDVDVRKCVCRLYRNMSTAFGMEKPFGCRQRLAPTAPGSSPAPPQARGLAEADQADRAEAQRIIRDALKPQSNGKRPKA